MDKQKLNHYKKVLLDELKMIEARSGSSLDVNEEEMSGVDNHPADVASELEMLTTEKAIEEHSNEQVEKIELALKAIEEGTYGYCTVCEEKIPNERLDAIPTALTCVEHAEGDNL